MTERSACCCGERKHRWLPPQHLRCGNRSQPHCFDLYIDPVLVRVDLQEDLAHTQRRTLAVRNHHLDFHGGSLGEPRTVPSRIRQVAVQTFGLGSP